MKKLNALLLILLCLSTNTFAQSADEILNKYFENTGGKEKWKEIKSLETKATVSIQGTDLPATIYNTIENEQRTEIEVQGKTIVMAYDGEVGWTINPLQPGGEKPQKLPEAQVKLMKEQKLESEFLDYRKKGHQVALIGKEVVDGVETYKIELTKKNGDVKYFYFDTENYVPIMHESKVKEGQMKGSMSQTYLSDYQPVGEVIMPFYSETRIGGQVIQKITMQQTTLNVDLDKEIFAFPEE